jgi:hypothetical protein
VAKPIRNQKKRKTGQKETSKVKQFFLKLAAVVGVLLTIYEAGQGLSSYAEWEPRLIIDIKPSPPNILDTDFPLKNDGKLLTLKNVHAKAQLL